MATAQENKQITVIEEDIKSIRAHLKVIKDRQDEDDLSRTEVNRKIDMIYNSLTDNSFNSNNGYITILRQVEKIVILHDLYWKILLTIIIASGVLASIVKMYLTK